MHSLRRHRQEVRSHRVEMNRTIGGHFICGDDGGVVSKRRYPRLATYCLDVDGDLYFVTYHHAAGFEGCVPGQSEFLAA
jgi:hypothetical protein